MFKKILIALAVIIVAIVAVAAMQPADYAISRSISINAPPAKVFAQVNDLHLYQAWNPFAKMDPAMALTYEGPSAGVGAASSWVSDKAGTGKMTVTKSEAPSSIVMHLEFAKPMADSADAEYSFKPEGKGTVVTWTMRGKNKLVAKVMHLFFNVDKMLGGYFETGLAQLKTIAETPAKK